MQPTMTLPEAAKRFNIPVRRLRAAYRDGELHGKAFRGGKVPRVTESDIERWWKSDDQK